jgi:hypothetical protein
VPTTRRRRSVTPTSPASLTTPQPQAPAHLPWLEHPTLSGLRDRLQLVYDCWTLLELPDGTSRRPLYLARGIEEPETCYIKRLEAARPTGFYRDALRTYAGMLSRLAWQELPDSLSRVATDVDGQGTDLGVFLFLADLLTLRDGGCLILQLPPQHRWPSEGDRLEALAKGDRLSLPRLQLVPRGDLLNWRHPAEGASGAPASGPVEIVWREPRRQALPPRFSSGNAAVPTVLIDAYGGLVPDPQAWLYRSFSVTDDGLVLRSWQANPNPGAVDGYDVVPVGEPSLLPQRFDLPALWYSVDGSAFGEGDLPHLGLAHQYLNHYRCRSDYEDLLLRTALPVGVRTGLVDAYGFRRSDGALGSGAATGGAEGQRPQRLVLSTSSFMDLPEGAKFEWVEIEARSLAEHRAYLQQLEEAMRRDALIPASGHGPARTELEVSLTAGQSFAVLQSLAGQKSSMLSTLLRQWTRLTGEKLSDEPACSVEISPLVPPQPPRKPQPSVQEWLVLHERGVIDGAELRQQLGLGEINGGSSS